MAALDWAKKTGRARFTGFSSHDRPHIKWMIEKYPRPARSDLSPPTRPRPRSSTDESGLWAAIKKHDVGWFGIKPFASNSLFKGDSSPKSPHAEEDNRLAGWPSATSSATRPSRRRSPAWSARSRSTTWPWP